MRGASGGRADWIHNAPRDPERVIRRAAGRVFHAGAPGINFDVRQFQPRGNEHFKNGG